MGKAKVLVVEDSYTQAEHIKDYLQKFGYDVICVSDGKSAIKTAKTQQIDIVLLDLVLPDISGNEVCRMLKSSEDTKGIPVIMLTVKSTVTDKVAGLEAGADDYLPKPYNETELNARIYASLRTKSLQDELKRKNSELEGLLKKVEVLAITDQLTGLYNRRHFETVMEKEFAKVKRYKIPLSCLLIDIDNFKRINDMYGHHTGDIVLRETAKTIANNSRTTDTVARWGGEEFIALLSQTEKSDALHLASRILTSISETKFPGLPRENITVSIGVATVPHPSINSEEKLIQAADSALYEAKKKGRNRVEIVQI